MVAAEALRGCGNLGSFGSEARAVHVLGFSGLGFRVQVSGFRF